MNSQKKLNYFIILYIVFLIVGAGIISFYDKTSIQLFFNKFNSPAANIFFKYITHLGNSLFLILIIIVLLFIKYRYALALTLSGIYTGIVVQFLKRIVFADCIRPYLYFKDNAELHLIDGVKINLYNSFPSGHSATAFSVFFLFTLLDKNNFRQTFYFLLALLTAYSRIYLSQHFFIDIYFGSFIGILMTYLGFLSSKSIKNEKLDENLNFIKKKEKYE